MPKREILRSPGQGRPGALPRLGFEGVTDVRQGKRFEVDLDGEPDDDRLAEVRRMAETLLANPVIEDFTVTVTVASAETEEAGPADDGDESEDAEHSEGAVEHAEPAEDPA